MSGLDHVFRDSRVVRRFGNLTAAQNTELLVSARAYNEQSSQAQRSVKSTSATDDDTPGSGARVVRITYLDSNYVLKTEDVALNGTAAVATVATDIRFIERFQVIKGTAAVGAIELWTNTNGTGTAICGIAAGTEEAFLCHHYVPDGKEAWVIAWEATCDDEVSFKLKGQTYFDTNLVETNLDLVKLFEAGMTPPSHLTFGLRELRAVYCGPKTRVWVSAVPNQTTRTVIRTNLYLWEQST